MKNKILTILFNLLLILWTILYGIIAIPTLFFPQKITIKLLKRPWTKGILFLLKIIHGITYKIEGQENIPRNSLFVIAAKHQSPFETFLLSFLFPQSAFILKRELLYIPFIGMYLWKVGMIFIDRNKGVKTARSMIALVRKQLDQQKIIIIFPEGTRTAINQSIPYKKGIALLYKTFSLPIVPVALNSGLFWPRGILAAKRSGQVTIRFLPPIIQRNLNKQEFITRLQQVIELNSKSLIYQYKRT